MKILHFRTPETSIAMIPSVILLSLALFTVLLNGCHSTTQSGDTPKPNVIVILTDDLGYNDISVYRNMHPEGQADQPPTCQTPHVDQLAKEGMLFTDFHCGAAVCSPSRSALITGRNCTRLGIYNWVPENQPMHLRSEEITLAELLKARDYKTGHFGKWHLTSQGMEQPLPNDQGFDYSFFTYNNASPSHRNPVNFYRNGEEVGPLEGYSCGLVVEEAMTWLKSNVTEETPFYINIWFNEPHSRVAAPPELAGRHAYNQEYYGCIENMDMAVGKLMEYLKENGLEENTIVMFTSDNGSTNDSSNDPLRGVKHFNYEGGVREPYIIKWPGKIPSGIINTIPASFTDVFPSIASITGIPLPADRKYDGVDLSPVFLGKAQEVQREEPIFLFRYFHDPICMLREGDWCLLGYKKLIPEGEPLNIRELAAVGTWNFDQEHMEYLKEVEPEFFELYNLAEDVSQEHNLAAEFPDVVERMKRKMLELKDEMVSEGGNWYTE